MIHIARIGISGRGIVALALALIAATLAGGFIAAPANATPVTKSTINVGASPSAVAVSANGTSLYVARGTSGTIVVMDSANPEVQTPITVGTNPQALVLSPDGTRLYVANAGSNNVTVINTADNSVVTTIAVGTAPYGLAMAPSGARLYVSNFSSSTVSEIDTSAGSGSVNTVVATISDPGIGLTNPRGLGVSPNGSYLYVANYGGAGSISIIDTATRLSVAGWPKNIGGEPLGVAVGSNGYVYVTRFGSSGVVVIDGLMKLAWNTLPAVPNGYVDTGGRPAGVAVSPDGSTVYVTNNADNSISILNSSTLTQTATVPVGSSPFSIAAAATGGLVYVGNSGSITVTVLEPGSPPQNTAAPQIFGTATKGVTLSATSGTWTYAPTYAYQWQTCTTANCTGGVIADVGTNQAAYQLTAADVGKYARVKVTASNGNAPDGVAYSAVTAQVADIENGFVFTTAAGGATIKSFDPPTPGSLANLVIPTTLGGATTAQIANNAFFGLGLTGSLTIPDSVTSIGSSAFQLNSLTSVTFGTSQTASQLTSIGASAFQGNPQLAGALTLPNSLVTIGDQAFLGPNLLTSVALGASQTASHLTTIGASAFQDTSLVGTLTLPDLLQVVGNSAFFRISNGATGPALSFASTSTTSHLWQVGSNAFNYASDDTSLVIPDSVTQIGSEAFRGFTHLTSLTFGSGTTVIGDSAFRDATGASITFTGDEPAQIAAWAFANGRTLTRWQGSSGWDDSYSVGGVTWPVQIAAPTVTSITPASGGRYGDQPVTITGTGFAAGATVTMGLPATDVVVVDSRTITARTPIGNASGSVGVTVTNLAVAPPIGTGNALLGALNSAYAYLPAGPMTFSSGAFPSATVGSPSVLTITVTNTGVATVPSFSVTGSGVAGTGGTCVPGSTLTANESCSVQLTWTPSAPGALTGSALTVSYPFGDQASSSLPLTGMATVAPTPAPGPTPAPTPTPTPAPTPTPTPVPTELKPGAGSLVIDGVATPVIVETSPDGKQVIVAGGDIRLVLDATGPGGSRLPLAPDGSLIVSQSGGIPMVGSGFAAGSNVVLYMFSSPLTIGTAVVDAQGSYSARATIPATAATGSHTIQAVGTTPSGQSIALSLGVTVKTPQAARGANPSLRIPGVGPRVGGKRFTVEARGIQARCMVRFSVQGSTAIARANIAGQTRTTLVAPASRGSWTVRASVYGAGCDYAAATAVVRVRR